MADRNVCSDSIRGNMSETFNFKNDNSNDVIVKKSGDPWPFTTGPDLKVTAHNRLQVTLINAAGKFHYQTSGCSGDSTRMNPKTVIIT